MIFMSIVTFIGLVVSTIAKDIPASIIFGILFLDYRMQYFYRKFEEQLNEAKRDGN